MAYEFKARRRVEFAETDMAGLMHFSNYFRFMESTENAFLRSLGFCVVAKGDMKVSWPRVRAECDYRAPLRFEDEVEVQLLVSEKRTKSLHYIFKFIKLNTATPFEVARGGLSVCCVRHEGMKMHACAIPKEVSDKIEAAPAELLV